MIGRPKLYILLREMNRDKNGASQAKVYCHSESPTSDLII